MTDPIPRADPAKLRSYVIHLIGTDILPLLLRKPGIVAIRASVVALAVVSCKGYCPQFTAETLFEEAWVGFGDTLVAEGIAQQAVVDETLLKRAAVQLAMLVAGGGVSLAAMNGVLIAMMVTLSHGRVTKEETLREFGKAWDHYEVFAAVRAN